jgi:hypothetical protein
MIKVDVSEWRPAPIDSDGERLFVVGDVHGCAQHLAAWLPACESLRDGGVAREAALISQLRKSSSTASQTLTG